jgi:hypothetical protein
MNSSASPVPTPVQREQSDDLAIDAPQARAAVMAAQRALRAQGAAADPLGVVQTHIAAVHTGDPVLMAADYSDQARITRGAKVEIPAQYFPRAVQRLGASRLLVHALQRCEAASVQAGSTTVVMQWELQGGAGHGTRGTDTFTIRGDRIVDQQVILHTPDY